MEALIKACHCHSSGTQIFSQLHTDSNRIFITLTSNAEIQERSCKPTGSDYAPHMVRKNTFLLVG